MEKYIFSNEKRAALEGLRQPFAVYQFIDGRIVALILSDGFIELFGYADRDEAVYDMDNNMYIYTHPEDVSRIADAAIAFAKEGGKYDVIYRTRKKENPDYFIVHAMGEHIYTDNGARLAQVWYTDERTYAEDADVPKNEMSGSPGSTLPDQGIMNINRYDFLTGLPSMSYFFELAEVWKDKILERGGHPMLLYFDFKGMKFFNIKYGFAQGDRLLRYFADILKRTFSAENCCHISADHFAVCSEVDGIEEKLESIFGQWQETLGDRKIPVHAGLYKSRGDIVHTSVALDRAKMACKALRGKYTSCFGYYNQELSDDENNRQYIAVNIDRAINEKWIQVYLQPIIRTVNGQVCDVEALARWIDPEKGFLSPADFIPALEESRQIYKLDLYMLDQVLESIKIQDSKGFHVIPHSINLSRTDFDECDIVEEFRRRVDAAGVPRDRITVEITESIIGSDFEFMKEQVERFRKLGFPVWMDDFGSGYSSLDVLQSIKFDLIKFDMSFMRKLDENEEGRLILTELMRLANALGVDTVCEGVEKESQVRFLNEIGCSKLQGYYFSKPVPFEKIIQMNKDNTLIANEDPAESDYYESIGRVNLFDLQNAFESIPIAVLEINSDTAIYVRSNRAYQEFTKRFFDRDILNIQLDLNDLSLYHGSVFLSVVKQCSGNGDRAFFDERMEDGSVVHSFARRVSANPVTGAVAVAVTVLNIIEADESTTYADIARALAADYYDIFVIDLADNNNYIEYSSSIGGEELSIERHGLDFFESARRDAMTRIYEEDRESFLKIFTRENVLHELDEQGVFTITYRLTDTGAPMYVNMKVTRMHGGNRLILGVSIVDAQMKQQEEEKRLRQEKIALGRIAALSPNYIVLYTVDPVTDNYTQYAASGEYESIGLEAQGEHFFEDVRRNAPKVISPEDLDRHRNVFTKVIMMREIHKNGFYIHNYRLLLGGEYVPVSLRAVLVPEEDGEKIIIGVTYDDNEEYSRGLEEAYEEARKTSVVYTYVAQALARGCTDLYYVNTETDELIEFHTDDELGVLTEARRGMDFFEGCERDARIYVHPDDQELFINTMTPKFLNKALDQSKVHEMIYRRIKGDRTFYVRMVVSRIEEDRRIIIVAVYDIDDQM